MDILATRGTLNFKFFLIDIKYSLLRHHSNLRKYSMKEGKQEKLTNVQHMVLTTGNKKVTAENLEFE